MPKRLLSYDPLSGLKTFHQYDEGKTTISYEQDDVQPVMDWAHNLQTSGIQDYNRKRMMWHAATIPPGIIMKWRSEGIDIWKKEDWPKVRAKLNDPEYRNFRTWTGRI